MKRLIEQLPIIIQKQINSKPFEWCFSWTICILYYRNIPPQKRLLVSCYQSLWNRFCISSPPRLNVGFRQSENTQLPLEMVICYFLLNWEHELMLVVPSISLINYEIPSVMISRFMINEIQLKFVWRIIHYFKHFRVLPFRLYITCT